MAAASGRTLADLPDAITYDTAFAELGGDAELARVAWAPTPGPEQIAETRELDSIFPADYRARRGFSTRLVDHGAGTKLSRSGVVEGQI